MADSGDLCTVLHVDMDAFFAAVEVLDDPTLAGRPMIVGGSGRRGVVASCTYEARSYGIRSAMSSVEARHRCPQAIFVEGRFWRYNEVSKQIHEVFEGFTPLVEPVSLDEAFLDVAGAVRVLHRSPTELAGDLRQAVRAATGLACSVGVARTKLLAKLASEAAKPLVTPQGPRPGPGVFVVRPEDELGFLLPLPVRALWGVGPATGLRLAELGVETVGDLLRVPQDTLCRAVGRAAGQNLHALARGRDARRVEPDRATKSIGHEETFASDLYDHDELHFHVVRMADAVSARLHEALLRARTVTVKVRFADRATITRSQSLAQPTDAAHVVRRVAASLLGAVDVGGGVRLLGVSATGLNDDPVSEQLSFDPTGEAAAVSDVAPISGELGARWDDVDAAVAAVRARYGQNAVAPAVLVGRRGIEVKGRGDTHWGPSQGEDGQP